MNKEKAIHVVEQFEKICSVLGVTYSDLQYSIKQLPEIFKLCKYSKGDRVILTKTPDINAKESWGWLGAKHFLIEGAKATIKEIEFYNGRFILGLIFDDESWIDYKKQIHAVDQKDKGMYMFGESWVRKINEDSVTINNNTVSKMSNTTKFFYIRKQSNNPNHNGQPVGVVAFRYSENSNYELGYAFWSPNDTYDARIGREVAEGRLNKSPLSGSAKSFQLRGSILSTLLTNNKVPRRYLRLVTSLVSELSK